MYMEIVYALLGVVGFLFGTAAFAVSVVSHVINKAKVAEQLAEAKAGLLGVETRLEHYTERKINESALEIRQMAQQDAFDFIQAQQEREAGGDLGFASFNRYGQ